MVQLQRRSSSQFFDMFHAAALPRVRKRSRPEEVARPGREDVKFGDVRLYLVEMKMGRSRRSFLTQLARSKGFLVEEVLRFASALHYENEPNALLAPKYDVATVGMVALQRGY